MMESLCCGENGESLSGLADSISATDCVVIYYASTNAENFFPLYRNNFIQGTRPRRSKAV